MWGLVVGGRGGGRGFTQKDAGGRPDDAVDEDEEGDQAEGGEGDRAEIARSAQAGGQFKTGEGHGVLRVFLSVGRGRERRDEKRGRCRNRWVVGGVLMYSDMGRAPTRREDRRIKAKGHALPVFRVFARIWWGEGAGKARSDDFTRPGARRGTVCADIALPFLPPVRAHLPHSRAKLRHLAGLLLPAAKGARCVVGNYILLPHIDLSFLSACMLSSCTEISLSFCVSLLGNAGSNYLTEVAGSGEEPGVSVWMK